MKELVTTAAPVVTVVSEIVDDTNIAENIREVFTAFEDYGYSNVVDMLLSSKFGDRLILFTDAEVEDEVYKQPIFAYLYPRWRYLAQCIEYLASEYNPIENYSGHELEEIDYDVKQRRHTTGQQINTHLEPTDVTQYVEGQHTDQITPAEKTITTTTDKQTTVNKVAPFESSEFFNKEQTTIEGQQEGGATQTQQISGQVTADQYNYAQKTNTDTKHYGMNDGYTVTDTEGQRVDTDDAHKDHTTRELDRHGNLGVMTAAQMMIYDADFWKKFAWLDSIAHELSVLLAESVWAM